MKLIHDDDLSFRRQLQTRPWGSYTTVHEIPGVKIKVLALNPGAVIPLQYHEFHNEHWLVLEGGGRIVSGLINRDVDAGQIVDIPMGRPHRIEAGPAGITFLEVQQAVIVPGGDANLVNP